MDYKKTIDTYINTRYTYLLKCAKNILLNNKSALEPGDLIAELVIHLYDNEDKIQQYIKMDKLEGFCVTYLNLNGKYASSTLNKKYKIQFDELDEVMSNKLYSNEDYELLDKDEYEQELHRYFNQEQIEKILKVDAILNKLTTPEKILFDAYFVKNLSYDKITQRYTFYREKDGKKITYKSKKSIYNMMNDLKNKINNLLDDDTI
jgi:protein associated with RNAse G/E